MASLLNMLIIRLNLTNTVTTMCQRARITATESLRVGRYSTATITYNGTDKEKSVHVEDGEGGNFSVPVKEWTPTSRRTGVIAVKLGMTQLWDKTGRRLPVTLLQVVENEVVMVRTWGKEGYNALQVGAINHPKLKRVSGAMKGQFAKGGVSPKRKLWEFRVSENALLPTGTPLTAAHFVPGQHVDVCAKSIGKGFQGVMKRHGMKGQPASHGVTKTHRKMGATGGGGDPGRIFPGKKMPGRMGGKRVTTPSLKVYRINYRFGVLYVNGAVPGHKNTYVRVTDAKRVPHQLSPPFPTFDITADTASLPEEAYSEEIHIPYEPSLTFAAANMKSKH